MIRWTVGLLVMLIQVDPLWLQATTGATGLAIMYSGVRGYM